MRDQLSGLILISRGLDREREVRKKEVNKVGKEEVGVKKVE